MAAEGEFVMGDAAHILQPFALGFLHDIDNYRDNGSSKSPDPQLKLN